jgi:hypothetical protein
MTAADADSDINFLLDFEHMLSINGRPCGLICIHLGNDRCLQVNDHRM